MPAGKNTLIRRTICGEYQHFSPQIPTFATKAGKVPIYIHQRSDWSQFTRDSEVLLPTLGHVRHLQGKPAGKMASLGFALRQESFL